MLHVPGPKNEQRMAATREYFALDHVGSVSVARRGDLLPRATIASCAPVYFRISEDDAKASGCCASSIDLADNGEESLIDWRVPDEDVDSISPHLDEVLPIHFLAANVSVDAILITSVAELDDDVAAVGEKASISDQCGDEIM